MAVAIQDIPQAAAATGSFALGVTSGIAKLFPLSSFGNVAAYGPSGTGAVSSRTIKAKFEECALSVLDFGADRTGVADSSTAFANAIAAAASLGIGIVDIPSGTYKLNSTLNINQNIWLRGAGRYTVTLNSNVTGNNHGMIIIGNGSPSVRCSGFKLDYIGAGQTVASGVNHNWSGIYVQRGCMLDEVYVNGFTNDGIFFAPRDASEGSASVLGTIGNAVFFAQFIKVWSKNNGRDGCRCRMGANANIFINCDFSNNDGTGFHHVTEGGATYGNVILGGQCSYNSSYGYHLESGTNVVTAGLYGEFNGSPTNTNTDGYTNTDYDFYIGDNLSRSKIEIGVVFSNSFTHVRAPTKGLNDGCYVGQGGQRIFGSTAYMLPYEGSAQSDSTATTVSGIVADFNSLLAKLRSAQHIA